MELLLIILGFILVFLTAVFITEGLNNFALGSAILFIIAVITFSMLISTEYKFISEETVITTKYTENLHIESKVPMTIIIKKYKPFKLSFRTRYLYIINGITITINK